MPTTRHVYVGASDEDMRVSTLFAGSTFVSRRRPREPTGRSLRLDPISESSLVSSLPFET